MSNYFNSLQSPSVGYSGTLNNPWIAVNNARQNQFEISIGRGEKISKFDYLELNGYNPDNVLDIYANAAGYQNGSISWSKSVSSNENDHDVLFQDKNGNYLEMNMDKGTYVVKSEKNIVEEAGLKMSQYDKLTLDQGGFTFLKFFKSGLGDGVKDYVGFFRQKMDNLKWGLTSVIYTEVSENDDTSKL